MGSGITVVTPTIPPRAGTLLPRMLAGFAAGTLLPEAFSIAVDVDKEGAARTRQRALDAVRTPVLAFFDDDDEPMADHLQVLSDAMAETGADYVYSWFEVVDEFGRRYGDYDPVFPPTHFSEPWDPVNPRHTTMIVMVRTELAQEVGFTPAEPGAEHGEEDWRFLLGCIEAGAKIHHEPKRTWLWHHDSQNTRGLPERW